MRKPTNNETQLINEIWSRTNKELNERRQVTRPSIYDPLNLDPSKGDHNAHVIEYLKNKANQPAAQPPKDMDPTAAKLTTLDPKDLPNATNMRRELGVGVAGMTDQPHGQDDQGAMERDEAENPWSMPDPLKKSLGWNWKDIQKKAAEKKDASDDNVIDFGDYEEGDVVTVDMTLPKFKRPEPEFPRWGEWEDVRASGQDDLGAMERAEEEKPKPRDSRFSPSFPDAGLKLSKPVTFDPNIFTEPTTGKRFFVSDPAKEAGTFPMPTLPEQPMDAAVKEFGDQQAKKFGDSITNAFKPKSKAEFSPVSTEEQPMDAATKAWRWSQKLPEQPMDTAVKQQKQAQSLGWKSGSEQEAATEKLKTKLDQAIEGMKGVQKTAEDAAKIRENTKKFVASQPPEIRAGMEREDKAEAAKQRMFDRLAGKPETSNTTMQAPSVVKSDSSGRDTKNIVPGSAMWSELSSSEKKEIADKYSRGEGPSVSVRYNKDTGKFDEPGYGDQGQYGDIVKALNSVNESVSVNRYCQFISEMAKKKTDTKLAAKPTEAKPSKSSKSKSTKEVVAPVKPVATAEPDLFSAVSSPSTPVPAPVVAAAPTPVTTTTPAVTPTPEPVASSTTPVVGGPTSLDSPTEFGGKNFPKVPEGYKGNIKYKLSSTSPVDMGTSTSYSSLAPETTPKGEMDLIRYLTSPRTPGKSYVPPTAEHGIGGSNVSPSSASFAFNPSKSPVKVFKKGEMSSSLTPEAKRPEAPAPYERVGPTTRVSPQNTVNPAIKNVLQNRTTRVAGGLGLAGAVLAGAALYGSQGSEPVKAAQQVSPQSVGTVNTQDTPLASKPKFKAISLEDDTTPRRLFNP